jgi:hypothetical protein
VPRRRTRRRDHADRASAERRSQLSLLRVSAVRTIDEIDDRRIRVSVVGSCGQRPARATVQRVQINAALRRREPGEIRIARFELLLQIRKIILPGGAIERARRDSASHRHRAKQKRHASDHETSSPTNANYDAKTRATVAADSIFVDAVQRIAGCAAEVGG